jgi:hypothetical protein
VAAVLQELGGAPPEELAGLVPGRGRPGLGHNDRDRDRGRDHREREPPGSDPCHLYVGYLAPHVTESMLEGLFRSCGEVGVVLRRPAERLSGTKS